jgi:hypothetical protein
MLRRLKAHLSFANVMSVMAVFIALGGGAYAATQLKKNSVGTKQIKNGAVKSVDVRNNSLTGADILESSLAEVRSASFASTATSANTATTADSANSVGGVRESTFDFHTSTGGATKTVQQNGVQIDTFCNVSGQVNLKVTPLAAGTVVRSTFVVTGSEIPHFFESSDPSAGIILSNNGLPDTQGVFIVRTGNHIASYDYTATAVTNGFGTADRCFVYGFVRAGDLSG